MGYTADPAKVRVDLFNPSGKWGYTVELNWDRYFTHESEAESTEFIHDTFRRCMREQFPVNFHGMTAVCLKPYHENAHPLMITLPE